MSATCMFGEHVCLKSSPVQLLPCLEAVADPLMTLLTEQYDYVLTCVGYNHKK